MSICKVVFIVGPTATGKSSLALEAVSRFGGEILNGDSIQLFSGLNIGSARPSAEDFRKCPHHLFGHVEVGHYYTAADYRKDALQVLKVGKNRTKCFYVVGGSGFYIQALYKGLFPVPPISDGVRRRLRELGEVPGEALFAQLKQRDIDYARKIGPKDKYRIIRALEVLSTGKYRSMEDAKGSFQPSPFPYKSCWIGLHSSRPALQTRVKSRAQNMIGMGLVNEVQGLLDRSLGGWAPLTSVGYREVTEYLSGKISEGSLISRMTASTMKLAKKQTTWFKRNPAIGWFDAEMDREKAVLKIEDFLLA